MVKKIFKTVGIIILLLTVVSLCYFFYTYKSIENKIVEKNEKLENNMEVVKIPDPEIKKEEGITNILILGLDNRTSEEIGRSDSIFILTIDENHNKTKLTAVHRDAYVKVFGENDNRKITEVVAVYGKKRLEQTIEESFGINIEGYISVDFQGFKAVVDQIGGVDLNINLSNANLKLLGSGFKNGQVHFNGEQALRYSRIRYADNVTARNDRQSEILSAIAVKVSAMNVLDYKGLLDALVNYVKTDMEVGNILKYATTAQGIGTSTMEKSEIPYEKLSYGTQKVNGIWNLYFDREQNKELFSKYIIEDLEPDFNKITLRTSEEILNMNK